MRVTVCQIPGHDQAAREAGFDALFAHARDKSSELVVIPEMPMSPWLSNSDACDPEAWEQAVRTHDSGIEAICDFPFPVVGSRPVTIGGRRFNQGFLAHKGLCKAVHHKRFLPNEPGYWEATWYEHGDGGFEVFGVNGVTAGLMICTDLWFIEHARMLGRAGAAIICHPRATERRTLEKWRTGVKASGVISGAYILSSNLWEPEEGESDANLGGAGMIADPNGEILGETNAENPFLTLDIDIEFADAAKSLYPRYVM